jgi:plasmid stabilization system protein ParE
MFKIKYLPSVRKDLEAIVDYISETLEAPKAALGFLDAVEKAINNLREFPLAHRLYHPIVPIETPYRVMPVKNYLVYYIVLENTVEIHRVIYSKRNMDALLG